MNKYTITLYSANCTQNQKNTVYPKRSFISNKEQLEKAVKYDYVCATYLENKRSKRNFICSNCLAMDIDNDETDDKKKWVTPFDLRKRLPDIFFYVHYSRNHMKQKGDKIPRPKFHVFFPIETINDNNVYAALKRKLLEIVPEFDANAVDAARFFNGTEKPNVAVFAGKKLLTEIIDVSVLIEEEEKRKAEEAKGRRKIPADFVPLEDNDEPICEGGRNATMHKFACSYLSKYGDTDEAYARFMHKADLCDPPLSNYELESIWRSASNFYKDVVLKDPNYILPENRKKNVTKGN